MSSDHHPKKAHKMRTEKEMHLAGAMAALASFSLLAVLGLLVVPHILPH
jgi:hypothetical protein